MYEPIKHARQDDAYDMNGTGEKGWGNLGANEFNSAAYYSQNKITPDYQTPSSGLHFYAQKNKKDISEHGIDENVHDFASDCVDVLKHVRQDDNYDMNGTGAKGWGNLGKNEMNSSDYYNTNKIAQPYGSPSGTHYYAQKDKKDISEHGIDENVHDFAADCVDVLKHTRNDEHYDNNGKGAKGWGDLGKNDMNSTGYYNANGIAQPYTPGYGQPANTHYYAQKDRKDISEHGIDENVHDFASDCVDVLKHTR